MRIGSKNIAQFTKPFVIAEISSNHHQDFKEARALVEAAARSGASAVKFQTYTADGITIDSRQEDFLISAGPWSGRSLFDLYSSSQMDWTWLTELRLLCDDLGLDFLSSVFDRKGVDAVVASGAAALKISSFEMTDLPLISYAASSGLPIIISTGLAEKSEIGEAVEAAGQHSSNLALLHCVSSYPSQAADYSIKTILDLHNSFNLPVGLSDHTLGIGLAAASVAYGASIFEKHFTSNTNASGSDDFFSADERTLRLYIEAVNDAFSSHYGPDYSRSEQESYNLAFRRSLYFVADVAAGELASTQNIRSIRPGFGMAPKRLPELLGRKILRPAKRGMRVTEEFFGEG